MLTGFGCAIIVLIIKSKLMIRNINYRLIKQLIQGRTYQRP
jgi:hypothetical protein